MIISAEHIEQPYDGEYFEKIYDIYSAWNSRDWIWIKFIDESGEWCGEFRGSYKGVSISQKLGIVVVLTSDHMYVLDINSAEVIEYLSQPTYVGITASPLGDIFVTDGCNFEIFTTPKIKDIKRIDTPINPDSLEFIEWNNNVLKMTCYEFLNWENEVELFFDCKSMQWIDKA